MRLWPDTPPWCHTSTWISVDRNLWHHRGHKATMASDILVIICSGNGLSPVRHQTFTHRMLNFCQFYPKECILMKCWLKCASFHPWRCTWNGVCKISAILLWCQRVNEGSMNSKLDLSSVIHRAFNSYNADLLPIILSGMYFDKMLVEMHKLQLYTKNA